MVDRSVCPSCSAVWSGRAARFCGRCGSSLVPSPAPGTDAQKAAEARLHPPLRAVLMGLVMLGTLGGLAWLSDGFEARGPEQDVATLSSDTLDESIVQLPTTTAVQRWHSPTRSDLQGVWVQVEDGAWSGFRVSFGRHGRFSLDREGGLHANPAAFGAWQLIGDDLQFTNEDSRMCGPGERWGWRIDDLSRERLEIRHLRAAQSDDCRIPIGTRWTLMQVSPAPFRAAPEGPPEPDLRPPTSADLRGVWREVVAGHAVGPLISFGPDGSFIIHDELDPFDLPEEQGRWDLREDLITFTSGGWTGCEEGESWAWQARISPKDKEWMSIAVEERSHSRHCFASHDATKQTFLRISPSSTATGGRATSRPGS